MAIYDDARFLAPTATTIKDVAILTVFRTAYPPGSTVPLSGIYRCTGCGHEAVSTKDHTLPTQNHHVHTDPRALIAWQLIVMTTHA